MYNKRFRKTVKKRKSVCSCLMAYCQVVAWRWISLSMLPESRLLTEWGNGCLRGCFVPLRSTEFMFELPISFFISTPLFPLVCFKFYVIFTIIYFLDSIY